MGRRRGNRGIAFETEISRSAAVLDLHYHKLAVAMRLDKEEGRLVKLKQSHYDSFFVIPGKGTHVAVELKSQEVHGSFPLSNIEEHQLKGLAKAVSQGCPAYLIFNMRRVEKKGKLVSQNTAWALPFENYVDLLVSLPTWQGKPRKSIPREFFDDPRYFQPLPRVHVEQPDGRRELIWDLRLLM